MTRTVPQASRSPVALVDEHFERSARSHGLEIVEVDIGDITFQAGQSEPVHRWFRLTPSYSPALVRHFLEELEVSASSLVLDPFAGRGTTTIECQRQGVRSIGFELNPVLHLVGSRSLQWQPRSSRHFDTYVARLGERLRAFDALDPKQAAAKLGTRVPDIHDVYRWWKPAVLRDLLVARSLADEPSFRSIHHDLSIALARACLDCANIHRNHPTITFHDDHFRDIDVLTDLSENIERIREDLAGLTPAQRAASGTCAIERRNSCEDMGLRGAARRTATHVITSPPYPNRFSYVHQTRPQLHFMELLSARGEATEIDLETIGGTWGRATSNLQKTLMPPPDRLAPILDYWSELSTRSTLMCNYATKYFVDLDRHLAQLNSVASQGFRGAYVVGNSRLSGVEIYTETILANLFRLHGFEVERIVVFRKRGGRRRLYESAVCVRRSASPRPVRRRRRSTAPSRRSSDARDARTTD